MTKNTGILKAPASLSAEAPEQERPSAVSRLKAWWKRYGTGLLFLAPFGLLFFVFVLLPVLSAVGMSFTYYNMLQAPQWLGLDNFRNLLMDDDIFGIAIRKTLVFALITGPLGFSVSFIVAWLIDRLRFKKFFALAFYAPS
ncbi:MAG: hypothetical protein PQJ58_14195, partial [Spirochaetales bacterium]|nr:hypothetical protein [Spirochaetales bacterium]